MLRATLKSLFARKLRLVLTALAVVLGVGMTAGSFILTDTALKSFDNLFGDVYKGTDVVVQGTTAFESERAEQHGRRQRAQADPRERVAQGRGGRRRGRRGRIDRRHGVDRRSRDEQGDPERRGAADRRFLGRRASRRCRSIPAARPRRARIRW